MSMDNELILFDRINIIRDVINKYGENNFYLSFSGGKDSAVLHYLIDEVMLSNNIPRVFCDTGIEYDAIKEFVCNIAKYDERVKIINPTKNIKQVLEGDGYPFKSKEHSQILHSFQITGYKKWVNRYLDGSHGRRYTCIDMLRYQFTDQFNLKVSDFCCKRLKKQPFKKWVKENNKSISLTGMMSSEGGARSNITSCVVTDRDGNLKKFHPLLKVSVEWEEWYIKERNIELCKLYYPPYNFSRTGCKGCPFAIELQKQLDVMEDLLPNEHKQCEYLWKPVYDEYRRLGYRLNKNE